MSAAAAPESARPTSGPSTPAHPVVPGGRAKIIHGVAYAPSWAPIQVQRVIWAGNQIRLKPYVYGGGHGVWNDIGYDCSGTVSYRAARRRSAEDLDGLERVRELGPERGRAVDHRLHQPGHAFIEIAGIRMDTSAEGDPHPAPGTGPRWRPLLKDTGGFQARHPASL